VGKRDDRAHLRALTAAVAVLLVVGRGGGARHASRRRSASIDIVARGRAQLLPAGSAEPLTGPAPPSGVAMLSASHWVIAGYAEESADLYVLICMRWRWRGSVAIWPPAMRRDGVCGGDRPSASAENGREG
jgi:hypothetical protein